MKKAVIFIIALLLASCQSATPCQPEKLDIEIPSDFGFGLWESCMFANAFYGSAGTDDAEPASVLVCNSFVRQTEQSYFDNFPRMEDVTDYESSSYWDAVFAYCLEQKRAIEHLDYSDLPQYYESCAWAVGQIRENGWAWIYSQ